MSLSCSLSLASSLLASLAEGEADGDAELALDDGEGEEIALAAFFDSSSLRFLRSCFARSSGLLVLVNAIDFPSGDQFGSPAPFGKSVKLNASPPVIGNMHNCGG